MMVDWLLYLHILKIYFRDLFKVTRMVVWVKLLRVYNVQVSKRREWRDVRFRGYEVESFSGRRYIYVRYGALTIW
jgi:hypothetical protein